MPEHLIYLIRPNNTALWLPSDTAKRIKAKRCFHYTNLRPLWAKTNSKKSDKTPKVHQWALL